MERIIIFVINFVSVLAELIAYAIIARVLLSWFSMGQHGRPGGKFGAFIYSMTDPIIAFFKRFPHKIGLFDFSPIIAMFAISFFSKLLIDLLYKLL